MKPEDFALLCQGYIDIQNTQYGAIEEKLARLNKQVAEVYPELTGNQVFELTKAQKLARAHMNAHRRIEKAAETRANNRRGAKQ